MGIKKLASKSHATVPKKHRKLLDSPDGKNPSPLSGSLSGGKETWVKLLDHPWGVKNTPSYLRQVEKHWVKFLDNLGW